MFEKLNELFTTLEKEFPYSTMSDTFKGSHHIYHNREGMIIIVVWANGKAWETGIENEDDLKDIPKLITGIRNIVDTWDVKTNLEKLKAETHCF